MEKVVALGGLCNQRKNTFTKIPSINSDYAEIDRATATMYFFWDKMNDYDDTLLNGTTITFAFIWKFLPFS